MATNTYVALDKVTIGTATNTVTFNSIPGTYTDLRIIIDGTAASNSYCTLRFNGDTNNNYSNTEIVGDGSTAGTYRNSGNPYAYTGSIYTSQTVNLIDILNYSNSTTFKSFSHEASYGGNSIKQSIGLWRSTSAITSITVGTGGATNFNVGTTFSLYGISNAGDASPKATGGDVYSDANYWYHAFTMSGNFVPNQSLSCDYLVVAGGGGGALGNAGGGGAGGYRTGTGLSVTAQSYAVLIGAGGAGGIGSTVVPGSNGGSSVFSSITSAGGGGGNGGTGQNGLSGGSGGGGGGGNGSSSGGAASPAGQGNSGGGANSGAPFGGGGGGGAGAAGGTGPSNGTGGIGATTAISGGATTGAGELSGGSYYFAGGGGGGERVEDGGSNNAGGLGGGATGSASNQKFNGTVSTGGGGGGNGTLNGSNGGGNGGSGIVIIRYAK